MRERALALYCAPGGRWRSREFSARRSASKDLFDALCEAGWSSGLVDLANRNYRLTSELLAPLVALLSRELTEPCRIEPDEAPPEMTIDEIPSWAYDMYSREGRAVFARFLCSGAASARWTAQHVRPSRAVSFLGHITFRVEGDLVDRRIRRPLADSLKIEADVECAGPDCPNASEILGLVRADIPLLNALRVETAHNARRLL